MNSLSGDLLSCLCSFLFPSDLINLSLLNRRFHSHLKTQECWKNSFLNWSRHIIPSYTHRIEKAIKMSVELVPDMNWQWFGNCTITISPTGKTYSVDGGLTIGQLSDGKRHGWCIFLPDSLWTRLRVGDFVEGSQTWGYMVVKAFSYLGEFVDGRLEGKGLYYGLGDFKGTYNGSLLQDHRHGYGEMRWPNGFEYKGEWSMNNPVDKGIAIHEDIVGCLERGVCTSVITVGSTGYGQFLIGKVCLSCSKMGCKSPFLEDETFYCAQNCWCKSQTCKGKRI